MDVQRTCGVYRVKPWVDSDATYLVRTYRVPPGTPALPILHRFLLPDYDGRICRRRPYGLAGVELRCDPPTGAMPVGFRFERVRYDRGARPPGWRPPTHYVGTPEQWLEGSRVGVHSGLTWQGEFSTACKAACGPIGGQACATGCPECPAASPLWCVTGFEDFAGLTGSIIAKKVGCLWDNQCVPAAGCPTGTAPAWRVDLQTPFAGIDPAYIVWDGRRDWTNCCEGSYP